jgi:glycosyltransferase involved in cell wall biosynthesis
MRIWYLLESTELCGGVRVVFDQARALKKRGHTVTIKALKGNHQWYPYEVAIDYVADFIGHHEPKPDVVIATFWTTVRPAVQLKSNLTFHFCQGYEGDIAEYASVRSEIESVYRIPIPKITVGPWLSDRLHKCFGTETFRTIEVGQIVDLDFFKPPKPWEKRLSILRSKKTIILLVGLFESSVKAIPDGLVAVALLRAKGLGVHLIRVSNGEISEEEQSYTPIDEYHTNILPKEMRRIYHKSDLFLAPSLAHEGFGLPFAEALACGVPSVATAIPSYLSFDSHHDYACFVQEHDPAAMAEAAEKIIKDPSMSLSLRKNAIRAVKRNFHSDHVAQKLEQAFGYRNNDHLG